MASLYAALIREDYISIARTAHSLRTTLAIMGMLSKTVHLLDQLEFPQGDKSDFAEPISALQIIVIAL